MTNFKVCIHTLLECMNDKDDTVNDAIFKSLCKIANDDNIDELVSIVCDFRSSKKKLDHKHIANILKTLEKITSQNGECLNTATVKTLVNLIINEMTYTKDYVPLIQMPSSGILVAVGNHHFGEVVEPLSFLLKPGIIPHYTIPHTLGTIAATNGNAVMPYMKTILGKMLPTLGMLKMDALQQAFSYALCHFSLAIQDFNENNLNAEMGKDAFSTEISISFDMLFLHWIHSNEPKVVENSLEAIGAMFSLLPNDKSNELVPKLYSCILNIYRKHSVDEFVITQCLTNILMSCIKTGVTIPPPTIDSIIHTTFHLILTSPNYDKPQKIKSHFELLRCFDVLSTNFPDTTLDFIFQNVKQSNEDNKMKAIVIITHLVTSSEISDKGKIENFTASLKQMIEIENGPRMKTILLKAIVALAYRHHLKNDDFQLLEFIIKQLENKVTHNQQKEILDHDNLIEDCKNSLYLLCSCVSEIRDPLWCILLKSFLQCNTDNAIMIITKCLISLIKLDESNPPRSTDNTCPSSEIICLRCLSLIVSDSDHAIINNVLTLLSSYCGVIHKSLKVSWEIDIKKMITYLNSNDFSNETWNSMVLDLFRSAISLVDDNSWIETLSHKILEMIPKNEKYITRKGILFKYLAVLLCHVKDPQSIAFRLEVIFNAIYHSSFDEGKYIAEALGIASTTHGLLIIEKLDTFAKDFEHKKSGRFLNFNFMKSKQDVNMIKYAITLCYGEVAKEVLDEVLLRKLIELDFVTNGGAIQWCTNQLKNNNANIIIEATLNTIEFMMKTLLKVTNNVKLNEKWTILNLVLNLMLENTFKETEINLYPSIIRACSSLIVLPKFLSPEERNVVLVSISGKVFNSVQYLKTSFETPEEEMSNDIFAKSMNDSLCCFNNLINEFIIQSTCPSTLDDILSILDEWSIHTNDEIRIATLRSIQVALLCFIKNIKLTYENPSRFGQAGIIMGKLTPRCSDKSAAVRYVAVDCIKILLQIVDLYDGSAVNPDSDLNHQLDDIQLRISTEDNNQLKEIIIEIGQIISEKVPHQQIVQLIETLFNGLYVDSNSAKGCNIVLNVLFRDKGQDLFQNIDDVMEHALSSLMTLDNTSKDALLESILEFSKHNCKGVVSSLLLQPLPFERCVNDCLHLLGSDNTLAEISVDHMTNILTTEPLFEESLKYENGRVVSVHALATLCGLLEIFQTDNVHKICKDKFSSLFPILYTTLACFIGAEPPAHSLSSSHKTEKFGFVPNYKGTKICPAKIALGCLKIFLKNIGCEKAANSCEECAEIDVGDNLKSFLSMVSQLVHILCKDYPQYTAKIVSSLNPYSRASLLPQRIAVVAFFNYMMEYRCNDDMVLLETIIATLNSGWKDTALEVRALSLDGLRKIKYLRNEQAEQYFLPVMNALYNGLDDIQGSSLQTNIPLIAINGIYDLLFSQTMADKPIEKLPPISQRMKSFFNTENSILREASIRLFGEVVHKYKNDSLKEQSLTLVPCFLLHLADVDSTVVRTCKQTLKKISPAFEAEKTNNMIQNHLIDSANLHLQDFITDLMKILALELPSYISQFIEHTSSYLNSPWPDIRANAAIIIGVLFNVYDNKDEDFESHRTRLVNLLLVLMRDTNPKVRACAATTFSSLCQSENKSTKNARKSVNSESSS